ncbi:MAG TPA: hypothetical protein VHX65_14530 [Pirellulales bacterium]|nr:hypothetical protein [Pirellulales bacterium]
MTKQFDLWRVLKQISNVHLRQFFTVRKELQDVPWDGLKETKIDPVVEALQAMPPAKRRQIQILFSSFAKLSDNAGLKVLLEELRGRYPKKVKHFAALKRRIDKVMWAYLNARDAYEEAVVFARADGLSETRYWNRWSNLPDKNIAVTQARIDALKAGLCAYYKRKELRGENCEIHYHSRRNGAEYLFAYLPDWPDNFMVFNDDGELQSLDLPTAFTNLFVYTPATGALEMIAGGGKPTQRDLWQIFCKALLGRQVDYVEPDRPAYLLEHLIKPGFKFTWPTSDRIDSVCVTRILVVPTVDGHDLDGLAPRFRMGLSWSRVLEILDSLLAARDLSRSQVTVEEIRIRIQLLGDGQKRGRVITINVTPRSCNLKSLDDEELREIGEHCFKTWRIEDDGVAGVSLAGAGDGIARDHTGDVSPVAKSSSGKTVRVDAAAKSGHGQDDSLSRVRPAHGRRLGTRRG